MNISCALSSDQVKGLFKYVYKTMKATPAGKSFNAISAMNDLFNKIESKEDADTAAKFLQLVPKMIFIATVDESLNDLELDEGSSLNDLRRLVKIFLNSDNGLLETLKYFRQDDSVKNLKNEINLKNNSTNSPTIDNGEDANNAVRFRASSAFTTTMQQFISRKPGEKFEEEIDPNRVRIFNTLEKIKSAFNSKDNSILNNKYEGRTIKLKGVKLSSIAASNRDKTTNDLIVKANAIAKEGKGENYLKDAIALVVTDSDGNVINFNNDGEITSADKGGKPVYQFLRNATIDDKTGKLVVRDIYGKEDRIQSVDELIENYARDRFNMSLEEFKKDKQTYDDTYEVFEAQQQADFKELIKIKDNILKNGDKENILFDILNISTGVSDAFYGGSIALNDFFKLSDNLDSNYKFTTLTSPRDGYSSGQTLLTINGHEVPVDRKNMSTELIDKIASVFGNPNISDIDKYNFYEQFSNNAINAKDKKLFVHHSHESGLTVSYRTDANNPNKTILNLSDSAFAKETIKAALSNERVSKDGKKTYNANMKINAELLNTPKNFYDYNIGTGEFEIKSYIDFLKDVNPFINFKASQDPGLYNSYFAFRVNDKLSKELKAAQEKTNENTFINQIIDVITEEVEKTPETKEEEATKADESFNQVDTTEASGISLLFQRSAKLPNNVTREEVEAAQEWWNNSPLSKLIKLEHMANIVNSDVYARFVIAGKRLEDTKIQLDTATGGSAVDLYHEAWHAFSQLYLTKEQKNKLYAETRKRLNNYDLSPLEVEEALAEEFRTYAKDPKPTKGTPTRNSLFRKILNFIKTLFGKRNTKDELFEKLFFASKNSKLLNNYSPQVDNAMFSILNRDRGILNVNTNELALSFQDSLVVSNQIDSALSELIDEVYNDKVKLEKQGTLDKKGVPVKATRNGTISLLTNDNNKQVAYNVIKSRFENKLKYFQEQLESADKDDFNKVTLLKDKIRILETAIANWGDTKSGVLKFHLDNSTFDLIKQKYIEIESEDEVSEDKDNSTPENAVESEKYGNKEVGDKSLLQLAEKETLYIIKSLFKVVDGKQVTGKLGFPELADFSRTWNIVTKVIGGEKDPVKMYQKLNEGIKSYPELKQLIENKIPDPKTINNIEEFNIKAAFWQDFKKTKLKYLQLTVDKQDSNEYKSEVTEASIEFTNIKNKFISEFKASPKTTYINKTDDNKSILNLDKVIADFDGKTFDSQKAIGFARSIGINLQDLSALKNELDNNKEYYGIQNLFNVVKAIYTISKDPNASYEHKTFIKKFLSNPIDALYGQIPQGIYKNVTSEKNIIQRLAKLQSAYGTNYSSFNVLNPEKNLVNEFIEDNTVSMIVNAINNVTEGKDLWTGDEYQYMSYLNPEINGFTLQSQILKNIFEFGGNTLNKRKGDSKIDLVMVAGTQIVSDEKGANTTSLDVQSKYIQELNMMLKGGIIEFMRHASKSSSFGMRLSNGVAGGLSKNKSNLYVDIDMFGPKGNAYQYAVDNIFLGYIQAELTRIQKFKGNIDLFKNYKGYNRVVGGTKENPIYAGEQFTAFDNVLKDFTTTIDGKETTVDLKQYLIDNVKDGDLKNYLKSNPEIKKAITEQVTEYFNGQTDKNYEQFSESPFYDPALMNKLNVFTTLEEEDKHKLLVKAYTMNAWIHNFETASLIYGDIVQYNHAKQEMHKRNTGSTSGGRGFMDDPYTQNFLNSDLIKKSSYGYKLGAEYDKFNYSNTYNTAIMQDVERDSVYVRNIEKGLREDYIKRGVSKAEIEKRIAIEIKKYKGMEEGDGQGFITIDAYRNLRLAESNWSADQEKLFQDIINDKPISANDVVRFFPVYKLQHFGHLANTQLPLNAMHKFALMPLIPSVIKGSDLESLHKQMMKGNIQYATFQTGSKVGSVTSDGKADKIYDDNGVQKTLKSDIKFTPNTIYLANLKNVTAVPTKYKGKTVFSTQLRKLILEGLYENGEIVNKDYAPYVKAYETAIKDYTNLLKKELLEEIGYEKVNGKYVSGDISKFMDVVQNELERKDLPEHLVKYIQVGADNKITKDLSLHLLADDIEKILVSLVEKRIVKQKVKGEALVQVASSMSNGLWDSGFKFDKANTKDIEKYLGSNNLPFYNPGENGKTSAMKVAIALQGDFNNLLRLNHNDKEPIGTRERLNEMIKNDEWLSKGNNRKAITMTAVRIPVQGLNSMEFMEVYEFLDPAAGNIIIPPSEIVAKSGADFDVDKLTTFMPNIDAMGHYIETSMSAEDLDKKVAEAKRNDDKSEVNRLIKIQKAALENRLISSIQGILELPDNYATLVRPNETYLLKDIADKLVDSSPEYKEFKTISPTNVLEVGYNLHKHEANMIGKDVLGIIALENSLHPLLTSLGAALPKTYKHQKWKGNKYVEIPSIDFNMRLLLNHNKTDDGRISLSKINSVDGQDKIADLISHLMNGSVDVEKDAWIFFIQANKEIVPVLLSLLKAGVPKKEAVYFVSQPLVKEYARQQRLIGSAFANVIDNGVDNQSFIKYQALQNTLAQTSLNEYELTKAHPTLLKDANQLKIIDSLKPSTEKITIRLDDGRVVKYTKSKLLSDLDQNLVGVENIAEIKDEYDEDVYQPITKDYLTTNENWYYTTQVLTKGIENFTQDELLTNITKNDTQSNEALAAFLHFIEFEKEIKGLSNLKRQANPDTKTSKTIQEITQKTLSLDEAADSSKIEPALAEKLQKESILGTFFDKEIIRDIITPLFSVTNDEEVSQFIIDDIARSGGRISKKFGPGKDGVESFITAYKNAIINYIYQNKLNEIISSEESFPGIPESLTDMDSKKFVKNFMEMISENTQLKEMYPILEQITDIPVKNKKTDSITNTITLNNKSAVKGELAEAYHQNLIDLANDNVIKVKDPVKNKEISDMFKVLPLMSILQNGVGNTKYGLSYVLPDTTFFEILEPAAREFLALDKKTKLKTLFVIDKLLFDNGQGENNYILSQEDAKAYELKDITKDEEVKEPVVKTQPPTQPVSEVKKKEIFTFNKGIEKKSFRGKPLNFVDKITTKKDTVVGMSNNRTTGVISVDAKAMTQKFNDKAWTKPAKQLDGSYATPLAENEFKTADEWFTFALIHEVKHDTIFKQEGETTGQYEDRINQAALEDLRKNYNIESVEETETPEEPQINKNMAVFNAEVAKQGRMPKEFTVGDSKWILNNNNLYDLVDKDTDKIMFRNVNMFTGTVVEETPSNEPVNQKQLYNFAKQLASGVKDYKLDEILAIKGENIEDIYKDINNVKTQDQLNSLINKILKAIC